MQNHHHVTPFSTGQQGYPEMPQENINPSPYAIDPSLEEWTTQQPNSAQYSQQPQYTVPSPQYHYLPQYGQPQSHQQPVFQQNYGNIVQSGTYAQYQAPANQYSEQTFFPGTSSQHNFASPYDFSGQPPQHETISPQALQVDDHIANDGGVVQNSFHRDLSNQQVYAQNPQQGRWTQEQAIANSSNRYSELSNGHVSSSQNQPAKQTSRAPLEYPSFTAPQVMRGGNISAATFDSRAAYPSSAPPRTLNRAASPDSRPNPLRVTNQSLLEQFSLENDVAHRVTNLPFAVLGEDVTKLDIRGKSV